MPQPFWLWYGHEAAAPVLQRDAGSSSCLTCRREEEGWESGGLYPATPVLPALSASVQGIPGGGGMQLSPGGCAAWSQAQPNLLHSLS